MAPAIPECIPIENDVKRNDLFDSDWTQKQTPLRALDYGTVTAFLQERLLLFFPFNRTVLQYQQIRRAKQGVPDDRSQRYLFLGSIGVQ